MGPGTGARRDAEATKAKISSGYGEMHTKRLKSSAPNSVSKSDPTGNCLLQQPSESKNAIGSKRSWKTLC